MPPRRQDVFTTVRTEGGILPADLLQRIAAGDSDLGGLRAEDYHLTGEKLSEAITRSWNRLLAAWTIFQAALARGPEGDPGTTVTRERWLLPLFQELGYGRLLTTRAVEHGARSFAVSHLWHHTPIHLVGARVDLDRRTARVAGAATSSPHGLVQELLNRSDAHLWGLVSDGLRLRILRRNVSLTRQAYVEFDLEAMMAGEVYADFALLWLVGHQSRVEADQPEDTWLERWSRAAQQQGTRALDQLREGVERAIEVLGRGFLAHPANQLLRDRLRSGGLSIQEYYRQLLRTVYRLLFLFVAEDRDLLLLPKEKAERGARERYAAWYSTARLRQRSARQRGGQHFDLWQALTLVIRGLGSDEGVPSLALPPLGSFLWSERATPNLAPYTLANRDLLEAVRALAWTVEDKIRRPVDYRNLGSEELGSIYEALLELHPDLHAEAATFTLGSGAGHERKTTGSYYTPSSLIQCLLDSALDPVLQEASRGPNPEAGILVLKVCDPACGSGHFLIAAAHRIARRLAGVRAGDEEPSPAVTRTALRDVIGRCIYGVDANEMAVELCKVSLWLETLEPGRPLSFLDHRIACGNSLLGTTPTLLTGGIPDDAFQPLEGDDRNVVATLRRRNRQEREGQMQLLLVAEPGTTYGDLGRAFATMAAAGDDSIAAIREKERLFQGLLGSTAYERARLLADAWCAAFVWGKAKGAPDAMTEDAFRRLESDPVKVPAATLAEILRLAQQYRFLHWHMAFPDVFRLPRQGEEPDNRQAGWSGGFDVVLGNPPWERVKLQEKEWFATRRPDITAAPNAAARRRMIAALRTEDPTLFAAWIDDSRQAEGESHLVRDSGRYPLCGRGDINTYSIFAETNRLILGPRGRVGCIVPSGIATDDTTKFFFQDLIESRALVSLFDFENAVGLFPGVGHGRFKFCLLTLTGSGRKTTRGAEFVFFAHRVEDLRDENRRFTLSPEDIALLNPNTRTCPIFRSKRDAELTRAIYRRVPVLVKEGQPEENPWGMGFAAMFHMANDSGLFRTREQLEAEGWRLDSNAFRREDRSYAPLYEAKMIHHFTHRFGDYADYPPGAQTTALPDVPTVRLQDPDYRVQPRYWVPAEDVDARLAGKWDRGWLLGWRDICRSTDERTVIASVIPRLGVGDKFLLMMPDCQPRATACLLANLISLAFDYCSRQKVGGTSLKYFTMKQLPVLPPAVYEVRIPWGSGDGRRTLADWLVTRVVELAYTAWDLAPFARDCGYDSPPFSWDPERRFLLRCELDAGFFHLYGVARDEVDYILETFPIVKRQDRSRFGEYRTKRVILEIYDALAGAIPGGGPWQAVFDRPPEHRHVAQAFGDGGASAVENAADATREPNRKRPRRRHREA